VEIFHDLAENFQSLKIRKSGPEVDIDERSTVFFTVRRPLGDGIKSFRQRALQVVETDQVPRPQNLKTQFK